MTLGIMVVDGTATGTATWRQLTRELASHGIRIHSSHDIIRSFNNKKNQGVWIASDATLFAPLARLPIPKRQSQTLFLFGPATTPSRAFLGAYFQRVIPLSELPGCLPPAELAEAFTAHNRAEVFVAGAVDRKTATVILYRGTGEPIVVPTDWFSASSGRSPEVDFSSFRLTDYGQTVALGDFEVSADAILYDLDPRYRRRRKHERIAQDDSLGASIRRLRLLRRLSRNDFPDLSAKTLARIERNEIVKPHRRSLATIAARLGVTPDDLASY